MTKKTKHPDLDALSQDGEMIWRIETILLDHPSRRADADAFYKALAEKWGDRIYTYIERLRVEVSKSKKRVH